MGSTRNRGAVVAAIVAIAIAAVLSSPADAVAVAGQDERHCVVEVIGIHDGVFVTKVEVCFDTKADAARHAADSGGPEAEGARLASSVSGLEEFTLLSGNTSIGTHYTSTGFHGSSVTIVGTTCAGGVWYPTGSWNNNLESSRHYCGSSPTTFYGSSNCSGGPFVIYSQRSTLGSMNNKSSCVRYG